MFAFVFDSVSGGEWLVLLAVVLVVIGPKNLPAAARKMGQVMSQLRRAADEFKRQIMTMDEEMKRTADELKKEYIDIPEDSQDRAVTENSGDDGMSSDEDPDGDMYDNSDYPNEDSYGYPEEDYYGATDENGNEVATPDPSVETAEVKQGEIEAVNGQNKTDSEKS